MLWVFFLLCAMYQLGNSAGLNCKDLSAVSAEDLSKCDILKDAIEQLKELQIGEKLAAIRARSKHKSRSPESRVFAFLKSTEYIKSLGFAARIQLNALKEFKQLTGYEGTQLFEEAKKHFGNTILSTEHLGSGIPDSLYSKTYSDTECLIPSTYNCKGTNEYRTFDGSCNNKLYPNRGRSNRAFARFLPPDYEDDIEAPRVSIDGSPLPSARDVSVTLFESRSGQVSGVHTQLAMVLGQLLDHDLTHTPVSKLLDDGELLDFDCGDSGCETGGLDHSECYPIPVSSNDTDFGGKPCIMFVRSQEFLKDNCEIGPREQSNGISGWIDSSHVYGSSKEDNQRLRDDDPKRGKLKSSKHPLNTDSVRYKDLLPTQDDSACRGTTATIKCFLAGDVRQNEQAGLTSLHTVLMRMHNVIEGNLHRVNRKWNGDKLFQESRRLLGAIWQNIVYKEYLPVILGPDMMTEYRLRLENPRSRYYGYDPLSTGDIHNAFAAAAFRFGHSMIGDFMNLTNHNYSEVKHLRFSSLLFNPTQIYPIHFGDTTGVDAIILGMLAGKADPCDRFFSKEITSKLFGDPPGSKGMDLSALNIQRGRDHGLPGYTKWLEFCGYHVPHNFSDLENMDNDTMEKLATLYKRVEDIDLFVGGISEMIMDGAVLGPTFGCIIAHQFRQLKHGDRFWFEGRRAQFTQDQIDNIKEFKLSKLFCETLDHVKTIQPYALLQPMHEAADFLQASPAEMYRYSILYKGNSNSRVSCEQLTDIDYSLWDEDIVRKQRKKYKGKNPFSCSKS